MRSLKLALFLIVCVLGTSLASADTTYYVDPNWGGAQNGAASNPWTSLNSSAWTTINTALASGNVTVYFSARNPSSNTNVTTTTQLGINRKDASTHMLTLDGISQYNTSETSPSWTTNVIPTPSNWMAASKFQITSTTPIAGTDNANACQNYITVRGFRVIATEGQVLDFSYMGNLTVRYVEGSRNPGGSYGPGLYIGPANAGPGCGGSGPNNVSVLNNYVHNTWGECIYIGASQSDPTPVETSPASTGDNYLIQGNRLESCAAVGGQGDGIDIKDGHTNLRIIGNIIRPSLGGVGGGDGQGIVMESGSVIDSNYIEAPGHDCVAIMEGWNNSTGRSALRISNNICVNITSGIGHNSGIDLQSPLPGVTSLWSSLNIYNNSIFDTNDACILIESGNAANVASVANNIMDSCGGGGLSAPSGDLVSHDYNMYFNISGSAISYGGSFACSNVGGSESHSLCADPKFVSVGTPYQALNFQVLAGSSAIGSGLTLSNIFTNDFAGANRVAPWDIGAYKYGSAPTPTPTPAPSLTPQPSPTPSSGPTTTIMSPVNGALVP